LGDGIRVFGKELQRIVRDIRMGRRIVDKLVKAWLKNATKAELNAGVPTDVDLGQPGCSG
jgi:hypothetical protein